MKWRLRLKLFLLLLLAGAAGLYWWWNLGWLERSQDVPIRAAAQRYNLSPALIKAVVWRESRFHPGARGHAGEIGLMQLQETAAQEWADAEGLTQFQHEHCLDPATNTLAGAFYLRRLLRRYARTDNPMPYALADYNAGRGNVLKWLGGEAVTNSAVFIDQIGFPTTRDYVKAVLKRCEHYERVFR
jgi:soluble lytic murein transglycosylase